MMRLPIPPNANKPARRRARLAATVSATLLIAGCAVREPSAPAGRAEDVQTLAPARDGRSSSEMLAAALQRAAERRLTTGRPQTILLRGGVYFLDAPLVLRPEHSGVRIAAVRNETPVLSGGRRLSGWRAVQTAEGELWTAELPEARAGQWFFRQLWVNGERRPRARHPNRGYLAIAEVPDATNAVPWHQGQTRFRFNAGELPVLAHPEDAEVLAFTRWVETRLPVTSVDATARLIHFGKRSTFKLDPGDPWFAEGAREFLDAPGEWFLDTREGRIFYVPRPGESLRRFEAIAPVLAELVRLDGAPETGQFVERVSFAGITFAHSEWHMPGDAERARKTSMAWPAPVNEIGGFAQAAVGVPGAVRAEGARSCRFENCAFVHLGGYALELGRGCQSNEISRCDFGDLGAGGIKLGETRIRTNAAELARANVVRDCTIRDGGKLFHSAVGLWIGQSPDNRIEHNRICDFYYTGISVGWTWGYGPAVASNNWVAFNHVHHIGATSDGDGPLLSDMGGIYTLGRQPGTRIVNNLWHDIAGRRYGGWGIYFDEGSSGILAESNVVYRTTHGGFHQHYGETNIVRNNIFAFARDHQLQRSREENHVSFSFSNNIVVFNSGVLLGGTWANDRFVMDANVYWDTRPGASPETMRFAGATLEQWRARGHDRHSLIADPGLSLAEEGAVRLAEDSPALRLGFRPCDLHGVGPRR